MSKKLVTVFGATGNQGGAVVTTLLSHPTLSSHFSIRAITRNTTSPKAQSLASKGIELAAADLNNPESLTSAIAGSHAVFAVTNYWDSASKDTEVSQGRAIADACVATGVKHIVWSALPNVTGLTGGTLKKVEHFDGKHEVAMYIERIKGTASPPMLATYFMPAFYMSNFRTMVRSSPNINDGIPTLSLPWKPDTRVPLLDAATDTGKFVAGILGHSDPSSLNGKFIQAVSEWTSPSKIVSDMSSVIGREVRFQALSEEQALQAFGHMPVKLAEELVENMVLIRDYSYYGRGSEEKQDESNGVLGGVGLETETFKGWVGKVGPWEF
ncbi:hypothetical protein OHC33_000189 [Knufia fluminis]|uniref:NmrA-like domain-containing protein n=1 Tax=Knufia fluminis TaxID=191047 RepID=A0AAN8ETD0_9EURO|nr:hypothetical protein OHC33_000189 [Knufia fluminis]